ncbi:MAG: hypothetical protein B0D91_02930 [Oceanospirillales bacterium LUC14_002_19_P2]|nr:MAG: hypothetical protein B0D91_02930 [Oceanospirillales bacterium LUC14_002_19_P2]
MRVFQSAILLAVVVGLVPGCSTWSEGIGRSLNRYPVEVIKTREDAGLRGAVTQVVTEGVQEQAGEDQDVGLLDVVIETYSSDGLRISEQVKGPVTDRHETLEMKWGNPVKRIVRENGELTLRQTFRYDTLGNIIKLDPPAVEDNKATYLATGDYRMLPGSQAQKLSPCFGVAYFEDKQLLRRCGEDFLRVAELDAEGRALRYMTFPQGVDLIANIQLKDASQAVDFSYDLQGRMKNKAKYAEGGLLQAHRYTYGEQGELVLGERESFGLYPKAEIIVYKDYRFDEQNNWIERVVEYYQVKDKKRVLKKTEHIKRTISYKENKKKQG